MEMDQRQVAPHDLPEAGIILVVRVSAPVAIVKQTALVKPVIIGAGLPLYDLQLQG